MRLPAGVLAVLAAVVVVSGVALESSAASGAWAVLWPGYKYSMERTGFFDVASHYRGFRYSGFRVLWKVKTMLCISSSPAVGDLNGDGRPEVAFSSCDGHLYVADGASGRILWNSTTGGGFASPLIWDVDGDGRPEVLVMGASGVLYAFNGSGVEEWEVAGEFIRGTPGAADLDGDGRYEVLAPSFDGSLYVVSYRGEVLARVRAGEYPVSTPAVADINGDGVPDAVVADGPYLVIILFEEPGVYSVYHVKLGDGELNGPPALARLHGEWYAVVGSQSCTVYLVHLPDGAVRGEAKLPGASDCRSPPSIGDVDGDGEPDIVVGSMQGLYILDTRLGVEQVFPEIRVYTSTPIIADVDGDGINEIVIGQESGEVDVVDVTKAGEPYSEIEWFTETGGPIMGSAAIADVDGDGAPEILIGSRDFYLYCMTGIPARTPGAPGGPTATATTTTKTAAPGTSGPGASHASAGAPPSQATPGPAGRVAPNPLIVAGAVVAAALIVGLAYLASRR